jgi:CubicO group peptidase (beta-lactamase class C family)
MKLIPLVRTAALALGLRAAAQEATYFPPPDIRGGWRHLGAHAELRDLAGLDDQRLYQAYIYTSRTTQHGGLLVVRHGWLAYERYFGKGGREAAPAMASVGKAITSVAVGILMSERTDLFPAGLAEHAFTEKLLPEAFPLDDPRKTNILMGHLLSMAAGIHGEGSNPGFVDGVPSVKLDPAPVGVGDPDVDSVHTPLWTEPGKGYSYSSASPHVASMILRRATGMELEAFVDDRLAQPMGWGDWGWVRHGRHAHGGGDCAIRATDVVRFGYLLLHDGQWGVRRLVPPAYVAACGQPSPYQRHAPFSLMFEVNADGHVIGAPRDAYFKSGGGGFGLCIIPSLDMVIYKMGGDDHQYAPAFTGLPEILGDDPKRDTWKPPARSQFSDGPVGTDDGLRRTIEMVCAAVIP